MVIRVSWKSIYTYLCIFFIEKLIIFLLYTPNMKKKALFSDFVYLCKLKRLRVCTLCFPLTNSSPMILKWSSRLLLLLLLQEIDKVIVLP